MSYRDGDEAEESLHDGAGATDLSYESGSRIGDELSTVSQEDGEELWPITEEAMAELEAFRSRLVIEIAAKPRGWDSKEYKTSTLDDGSEDGTQSQSDARSQYGKEEATQLELASSEETRSGSDIAAHLGAIMLEGGPLAD